MMTAPRKMTVFLSSTVYDLKDLRNFLEFELKRWGYEVLASESGSIPVDSSLHSYETCIAAAKECDVLIGIIDGRFGGMFRDTGSSITFAEIDTAFRAGKRVYVFVRRGVWDAREQYKRDRQRGASFSPSKIVTDERVFQLVDQLLFRDSGNWLFQFELPTDILDVLVVQLDGPITDGLGDRNLKRRRHQARREIAIFDEPTVLGFERLLSDLRVTIRFLVADRRSMPRRDRAVCETTLLDLLIYASQEVPYFSTQVLGDCVFTLGKGEYRFELDSDDCILFEGWPQAQDDRFVLEPFLVKRGVLKEWKLDRAYFREVKFTFSALWFTFLVWLTTHEEVALAPVLNFRKLSGTTGPSA